ncbi:hypothetical protein DICSQDRAFT_171157 [Dichomitus squalens LYAD-421 SS1]|uniref:Uncharacterized protein n=1 Tax=Dichomitus squalens (strain LYAD-421) TaxID=732165 RepID=R7SXM1_DICSQ|nr:uncharacterized protein DICSQDRAFT_171157 [Dichomitus squalens LYAD-421 SS1]EJF60485.1 hypothetical protein DICSQDRAFT_171157 [Dichomitus squalens LYAD-421 SS1]
MDCTIILWDSDGRLVQEWVAHPGSVLAFSPDSRYLVSGSLYGNIAVWDVSQGARKIATLEGHTQLVNRCVWSPDGTLIASGSWDQTVRLWDTRAFQQLHVLDVATFTNTFVHGVCLSSDGRWLVLTGFNMCCVWDVGRSAMHKDFGIARGEDVKDKAATDEENEEDKGEQDKKHEDADPRCYAAALNAQGTHLATGYEDGSVRIWDVQMGQCLVFSRMHVGQVIEVAFSSDGTRLLSIGCARTAKIWDASSGSVTLSLEGHTGDVRSACFSPCGKYVTASASWDQTVGLWRTDDGSCVGKFSEHKYGVSHVTFSPDGQTLSSGADNGSVVIRRMRDILSVEDMGV